MRNTTETKSLDFSAFRMRAEAAARAEQTIQRQIDEKEKRKVGVKKNGRAMQAGARIYPEPPLPAQRKRRRSVDIEGGGNSPGGRELGIPRGGRNRSTPAP